MAGRKAGQGHHWIKDSTRFALLRRGGDRCVYCGRSPHEHGVGLTLDHIVACELGGTNDPSNLVPCCVHCNSSKQHKTMIEWYRVLRSRGINTKAVGQRIRRQTSQPLTRELRAEGRRRVQIRKASRQAKAA